MRIASPLARPLARPLAYPLTGHKSGAPSFMSLHGTDAEAVFAQVDLGTLRGEVVEAERTLIGPGDRVFRTSDNTYRPFLFSEIGTPGNSALEDWVGSQNLLTYSQDFTNAQWVKTNATITGNDTTAPDGTTTADKVEATSAGGQAININTDNVKDSTVYTASVYVKQGDVAVCRVDFRGVGVSNWNCPYAFTFATQDFSKVGADTADASYVEDIGDGWYRLSLVYTSNTSMVNTSIYAYPASGGTGYTYYWGAQINKGSTAATYNPTTSGQGGYGYLNKNYTQTANTNDAVQTTVANMPLIVDEGTLVTDDNGNVAPDFDGSASYLVIADGSALDMVSPASWFSITQSESVPTGFQRIAAKETASNGWNIGFTNVGRYELDIGNTSGSTLTAVSTDVELLSWIYNFANTSPNKTKVYSDGMDVSGTDDPTSDTPLNSLDVGIGARPNGAVFFEGKIAALLMYSTANESGRAAIEAALSKQITTALS